jgi:hypothetical protein
MNGRINHNSTINSTRLQQEYSLKFQVSNKSNNPKLLDSDSNINQIHNWDTQSHHTKTCGVSVGEEETNWSKLIKQKQTNLPDLIW